MQDSIIKSIQTGVYSGAGGDITINAVVMEKTVVYTESKGSTGYVAGRGNITGTLSPSGPFGSGGAGGAKISAGVQPSLSGTRTLASGTTDLTVKHYSAYLKDTTHITADGPVEWQVIEYN